MGIMKLEKSMKKPYRLSMMMIILIFMGFPMTTLKAL